MTAPNPALEQFLKSIPLFSLVDPPDMMDLLRLLRPVTLDPGQVLFREGTPGVAMWVLGQGTEVTISTTPKEGKRPVVIAYAKTGETVGEMALIEDGPRSATAVVMQGGLAHEISAVEFQTLRQSFSPAAFKVLRRLCVELCSKLRATADRVAPSKQEPVVTPPLEAGRVATREDIDAFPALRPLPSTVKLALTQKMRVVETTEFMPIFAEGDAADAAYFLLEGEVMIGRGGKTLATLGAGNMFGIVAAIDSGTRSASVIANGPTRMLRLTDADFDQLFATGNRFAFALVDMVARQLVQHVRSLNAMVQSPGGPRLTPTAVPVVASFAAAATARPTPVSADSLDSLAMELELDLSPEMPDGMS